MWQLLLTTAAAAADDDDAPADEAAASEVAVGLELLATSTPGSVRPAYARNSSGTSARESASGRVCCSMSASSTTVLPSPVWSQRNPPRGKPQDFGLVPVNSPCVMSSKTTLPSAEYCEDDDDDDEDDEEEDDEEATAELLGNVYWQN